MYEQPEADLILNWIKPKINNKAVFSRCAYMIIEKLSKTLSIRYGLSLLIKVSL